MITRIPDYFDDFHCLAGSCPDTCCGPWQIVVDEEATERYLALEGELGERIRARLITDGDESYMTLEHSRCSMLTEDGLCPIVAELGNEFLCTSCRDHPRFTEIYGGLQETMLSMSCPEAARLLLERQAPLNFVTKIDMQLPEPDDLDADQFDMLLTARQTAFKLVQDRSRSMADRLCLLLCFARRLQKNMQELTICEALCARFESRCYQDKVLLRVRRKRGGGSMTRVRQLMLSMEPLSGLFPKALEDLECTDLFSYTIALEQITVYFLFRWWLKAACDDRLWHQAAATVISVLTIAGLAKPMGTLTEAARHYSKEVEHSEDNLALLRNAMDLPYFSYNELLKLLEVSHAI